MTPASPSPQATVHRRHGPLWVGDWRVTPERSEISRAEAGGETVRRLEPKAMALLLHLARRPGQMVGQDELMAKLWPGLVVGDKALGALVAQLREALGDTVRAPRYLEAVPKNGCRLVAPVRRAGSSAQARRSPRSRRRWLTPRSLAAVVVAALLVAALTWWAISRLVKPPATDGAAAAQTKAANTPGPRTGAAALGQWPGLHVRPFEGPSLSATQAALPRALTADLVSELSQLAGLRVSTGYAPAPLRPGSEVPQYTLAGTVQADGDQLRLDMVLTDDASGQVLWSEHFERPAAERFALQDELVQQLLAELPIRLGPAEQARLARRPTRHPQAQGEFLAAQAALLARRRALNTQARQGYWSAIGLDPAYARAYAGVAMTYALDQQQGWSTEGPADLARALELADTALKMRPDAPEAHWVAAFVRAQRQQHADALRALDEALRLAPSYADAYALQAGIATLVGRPADTAPLLRTALQLNTDGNALYALIWGRADYFLGDHAQARVHLGQALDRDPQNLEARLYLAATCRQAGDAAGARWQVEEIRSLAPRFNATAWLAGYPLIDPAQARRLRDDLNALGL